LGAKASSGHLSSRAITTRKPEEGEGIGEEGKTKRSERTGASSNFTKCQREIFGGRGGNRFKEIGDDLKRAKCGVLNRRFPPGLMAVPDSKNAGYRSKKGEQMARKHAEGRKSTRNGASSIGKLATLVARRQI